MRKKTDDSFAFEVGGLYRHGITVFRINEMHGDICILQNMVTLDQKTERLRNLNAEYLRERIVPCASADIERAHDRDPFLEDENETLPRPLIDLGKAAMAAGSKKLRYMRALRELGYSCLRPTPILKLDFAKLVKKFDDPSPPKPSTIYACSLRVDANGGDLRAAYPNYKDRGGRGGHRWSDVAEAVFSTVAKDLRSSPKVPIRAGDVEARIRDALISTIPQSQVLFVMPSRSSIERRLPVEFGEYEIYLRNHGEQAAKKKYRTWYPRDSATMPLEVVEFDDKDSRCFLWDAVTDLPCGRGFVTSGVDQYSTVPMGFSISDQHRNVQSAKEAFLASILPFDSDDPNYAGLKEAPEFYGRMGIAVFDNALYNHASELEATVTEVAKSTITAWSKPFTPTEKAVVEDFNGRMVMFFSRLPGFGGPKGTKDQLQEGVESSCLTTQDFRRELLRWSYDEYCSTPREGGLTPTQRWVRGTQNITPRVPNCVGAARLAATLAVRKKLRPEGISLAKGLSYQNPQILVLQRYLGANAEITFRYNPNRLALVWALDPRVNEYFPVPSTTPEYTTRLSLYQHKLILKMNKELGKKNPALLDLRLAREKLQEIVRQMRFSKKRRERAKGKRLANDDNVSRPESKFELVTDLEATISSIDDIEMEAGEEGWDVSC